MWNPIINSYPFERSLVVFGVLDVDFQQTFECVLVMSKCLCRVSKDKFSFSWSVGSNMIKSENTTFYNVRITLLLLFGVAIGKRIGRIRSYTNIEFWHCTVSHQIESIQKSSPKFYKYLCGPHTIVEETSSSSSSYLISIK